MPAPLLRIIPFPDARLATPVSAFDEYLESLATAMLELMRAHGGIGLAANQAGVDASLLVADVPGQIAAPLLLANPRLLEGTGQAKDREGCLRFPRLTPPVVVRDRVSAKCRGQPATGGGENDSRTRTLAPPRGRWLGDSPATSARQRRCSSRR